MRSVVGDERLLIALRSVVGTLCSVGMDVPEVQQSLAAVAAVFLCSQLDSHQLQLVQRLFQARRAVLRGGAV